MAFSALHAFTHAPRAKARMPDAYIYMQSCMGYDDTHDYFTQGSGLG